MNLRHGLKIAKELVGVSITALAAAIADEVKEYDRRFQQGGYRALAKTPASARVLMGLAYAEFLAESRMALCCKRCGARIPSEMEKRWERPWQTGSSAAML